MPLLWRVIVGIMLLLWAMMIYGGYADTGGGRLDWPSYVRIPVAAGLALSGLGFILWQLSRPKEILVAAVGLLTFYVMYIMLT